MMMLFCLANCYVLKFLEKNVGMKKYFITGLVGSATVQKSVTEQGLLKQKKLLNKNKSNQRKYSVDTEKQLSKGPCFFLKITELLVSISGIIL
jgi:hypothetical protein